MDGCQFAGLVRNVFLVVNYHLIAVFQLYGLLQLSLICVALFKCKEKSVTCKWPREASVLIGHILIIETAQHSLYLKVCAFSNFILSFCIKH